MIIIFDNIDSNISNNNYNNKTVQVNYTIKQKRPMILAI